MEKARWLVLKLRRNDDDDKEKGKQKKRARSDVIGTGEKSLVCGQRQV
jgi:hypothetical protein